jgi:Holliday junction resolvase-like predicted endonuclease
MVWQEKIEVKKGNIGEDLVAQMLKKNNYVVYSPKTDGSHNIDFIAHQFREGQLICCEVKTKKRMAKYARTGFNLRHHEGYKQMKERHNMDTFVAFVDDFERCIYGNWLDKLGEGFKRGNKNQKENKNQYDEVIVFPLENMVKIDILSEDIIKKLQEYTKENDNYDYSNVKRHFEFLPIINPFQYFEEVDRHFVNYPLQKTLF